jgi:hypothetical protein
MAGGIDFFLAAFAKSPDRRNPIAFHANVRSISWQSCAVDYGAVADHEIVHGNFLLC